jgi:hypothetical protein
MAQDSPEVTKGRRMSLKEAVAKKIERATSPNEADMKLKFAIMQAQVRMRAEDVRAYNAMRHRRYRAR